MSSSARRYKLLRVRTTRVSRPFFILPSEAKGRAPPPEHAQHFSGRLEPACELLRPVRDNEVGAGALDCGEGLDCRLALVEKALPGGRLHHRVFAGDVVRR